MRRLASRIPGSIRTATRVTSVRNEADAVVVKAIADDWGELEVRADVAIVATPAFVALDRIDAEADDLDAALVELRLDAGHVTKFGRTHRREVLGVRKHHAP